MERSDVPPISIEEALRLKEVAERARKNVIKTMFYDQSVHVGSSLSSIDILTTIYMKYRKTADNPIDRDWIILSKGHAAPALYAVLIEVGLIPIDELWKIQDISGILQGHPEIFIPGVDMSTGSLGQGLSYGAGVAQVMKMKGGKGRVYVIMGDGEQDEGQIWEASTHVVTRKLNNITAFIEVNGYQLDASTVEVKPKHYLEAVWRDIGWNVLKCDGHDILSIGRAIEESMNSDRPSVIFAQTMRGKGLPEIENTKKQRSSPEDARKYLVDE